MNATPRPDALPAPMHDDAELIRLCGEFMELERRINALYHGPAQIADDRERDAAIEPIHGAQVPLVAAICDMRATTVDGYRAFRGRSRVGA